MKQPILGPRATGLMLAMLGVAALSAGAKSQAPEHFPFRTPCSWLRYFAITASPGEGEVLNSDAPGDFETVQEPFIESLLDDSVNASLAVWRNQRASMFVGTVVKNTGPWNANQDSGWRTGNCQLNWGPDGDCDCHVAFAGSVRTGLFQWSFAAQNVTAAAMGHAKLGFDTDPCVITTEYFSDNCGTWTLVQKRVTIHLYTSAGGSSDVDIRGTQTSTTTTMYPAPQESESTSDPDVDFNADNTTQDAVEFNYAFEYWKDYEVDCVLTYSSRLYTQAWAYGNTESLASVLVLAAQGDFVLNDAGNSLDPPCGSNSIP